MTQFSMSKRIESPADVVFDVATDLAHAAEHVRGIEKIELLTDGPVGVGTRWRETRRMMGREATETIEIVAFERPKSYTAGCESCGNYIELTFRFEPDGAATNLTLDVRMESRTLFAKLMSPVGNALFGKTMRQCMDDDLEDLKAAAEVLVKGIAPSR